MNPGLPPMMISSLSLQKTPLKLLPQPMSAQFPTETTDLFC